MEIRLLIEEVQQHVEALLQEEVLHQQEDLVVRLQEEVLEVEETIVLVLIEITIITDKL